LSFRHDLEQCPIGSARQWALGHVLAHAFLGAGEPGNAASAALHTYHAARSQCEPAAFLIAADVCEFIPTHAGSPLEPLACAYVFLVRASYLRHAETGDRTKNLAQAIACFKEGERVFTRVSQPKQWAAIQHDLGLAYTDYDGGDPAENRERAIAHYRAA